MCKVKQNCVSHNAGLNLSNLDNDHHAGMICTYGRSSLSCLWYAREVHQ
nr:MAG TPA: hypothetical protein [Caudoviricetes sp.]